MRIRLSRAEGTPPIYSQVASLLRQRIRNGELGAGMKLPKELDLAQRVRRENFHAHTMVDMLRKRLKIPLGPIRQAIQATTADPTIARQLGTRVGAPVLYVETRIWRKSGAPLMFSQAYYRGDRSSYSIEVPG